MMRDSVRSIRETQHTKDEDGSDRGDNQRQQSGASAAVPRCEDEGEKEAEDEEAAVQQRIAQASSSGQSSRDRE